MKQKISVFLKLLLNSFSKLVPVNQKMILFETGFERADDNPRGVYDYLLKENTYGFIPYFIIQKTTNSEGIRPKDIIYRNTPKYFYVMMRAKFWIRSQSLGSLISKKSNQVLVQLWHGSEFKKCGYDVEEVAERPIIPHAKEWDVYVTVTEKDLEIIRHQIGYTKRCEILGNPRTDILFDEQFLASNHIFREKYSIPEGYENYILYAPTFRDWDIETEDFKFQGLIDLIDVIDKKTAVLVRFHPIIANKVKDLVLPENFFSVTHVHSLQELFVISDVLITDYSSIVYDFSLVKNKVVFYIYDEKEYVALRGGFYYSIDDEMPGVVARDKEALRNILERIDESELEEYFLKDNIRFNKSFNSLNDGKSAKRVVELLDSINREKS